MDIVRRVSALLLLACLVTGCGGLTVAERFPDTCVTREEIGFDQAAERVYYEVRVFPCHRYAENYFRKAQP